MLVGIIGKPNVGKSTFFSAATLKSVPVADYPFTTIKPNMGMGYLRTKCVHEEMGVTDNPRNSTCANGTRLIPVRLVDVAGLVTGASSGRGLGNQFLDELRQADALIHVVDASGSTDEEGRKVTPGTHDPESDIEMVEKEFDLWIESIVVRDWERTARIAEQSGSSIVPHLSQRLTGLGIGEDRIEETVLHLHLRPDKPLGWSKENISTLVKELREKTKPSLIAANKSDLPGVSPQVSERLAGQGKDKRVVVSCAAEAELLLRRAAEQRVIEYTPGDSTFKLLRTDLTTAQQRALELVNERVLLRYGSTGVQQAIDLAYFGLLHAIVVYPVEDESKLSDKNGNVLPDAHVMTGGSTTLDLARKIHSDLADGFLYAVDARTGMRLSDDYLLRDRDIVKIVSSGSRS